MSTYICENCNKELKSTTFYVHSRHCYDVHLAICNTCSQKKLYTKPELESHSNHTIEQVRSYEQQKEMINTFVNPMKKRKKQETDKEEQLMNTKIKSCEEEIQTLKDEAKRCEEQLNEKEKTNKMQATQIEQLKETIKSMNKYEEECRVTLRNYEKAVEALNAQLRMTQIDYRIENIRCIVISSLSCIYEATLETKSDIFKPIIIKQFLDDRDRKEELAIQTRLNNLPCVRKYLSDIEFPQIAGFPMIFDYYDGTLSKIRENNNFNSSSNTGGQKLIKSTTKQAFEALHQVHQRNVLHLDVKPNNFLYNYDQKTQSVKVVIGDFGLSRSLLPMEMAINSSNRAQIVQSNTIPTRNVGTEYFKAPEIYNRLACKASDIYSMGISLLIIFTKDTYTLNALQKELIHTKCRLTTASSPGAAGNTNTTRTSLNSKKTVVLPPKKSAQAILNQTNLDAIVPEWCEFFFHMKPMINKMLAHNLNQRPTIPDILQHIDA